MSERMSEECQIECQKECQIECQKACQIECQKECQKECQNECQIECYIECQNIWRIECQIECEKECQYDICQIACQIECENICQIECQKECHEWIQGGDNSKYLEVKYFSYHKMVYVIRRGAICCRGNGAFFCPDSVWPFTQTYAQICLYINTITHTLFCFSFFGRYALIIVYI